MDLFEGRDPARDASLDPDEMGPEGGLDRAEPISRLGVDQGVREAGTEARGDAIRGRAAQRVAAEKGVAKGHGGVRCDRFPIEARPDRPGVGVGALAALVAREVDVGEIDECRLAPALGVLVEVFPECSLVDGLAADAGADDGLDAVDQTAADDRVAPLHAERDGPGIQRFVGLGRLWIEEAHVLDQALVDHRVDLGKSDREGLVQPERVFDRLILECPGFFGICGPPDLEGESLDPFRDLAARHFDGAPNGLAAEARLEREEQRAERKEMEQRCTQQTGAFRMGPEGYRNRMNRSPSSSLARDNLALVDLYFALMQMGDPGIAELFMENARWLAPQAGPLGRCHEGRGAVLALMASGIGLYDSTRPMQIERTAYLAGDDLVYIEMTIRATTKGGLPYENHYVMVFQIQDGRIAEVREHVDSLYAQRLLFDPVGMASSLDARGR